MATLLNEDIGLWLFRHTKQKSTSVYEDLTELPLYKARLFMRGEGTLSHVRRFNISSDNDVSVLGEAKIEHIIPRCPVMSPFYVTPTGKIIGRVRANKQTAWFRYVRNLLPVDVYK